jgi:hypothetical protein
LKAIATVAGLLVLGIVLNLIAGAFRDRAGKPISKASRYWVTPDE